MQTQLMCITCRVPIDQSESRFAQHVRVFLHQKCAAGWTGTQVKDTLVRQFGEEILAAPPKQGFDLLAWLVPGAVLLGGLGLATALALRWAHSRQGPGPPSTGDVDPALAAPSTPTWRGSNEPGGRSVRRGPRLVRDSLRPSARARLSVGHRRRLDGSGASPQGGRPFVIGFSAVFVALGVTVGLAGSLVTDHRLQLIHLGGIVIVAMGFLMMGAIRIPAFERSLAPGVDAAHASGSSLLLGGAFGLCWTPCVGPVLGSILALAATEATAARGAGLLAAYAAGLAVPFLAVALGLGQAMSAARFLRDRYATLRVVSGVILVAAGLLVFFDKTYIVNAWVAGIGG